MNVKWIIENFTDSEDYRDIIKAVRAIGRDCFVIDKRNHLDFDPSGYKEGECVIVQGSIQMTKKIRERLPKGCFPIDYSTWDNYLCSAYYPYFKPFLFNDNNEFVTVGELKKRKFDFYRKFGKAAVFFIRPDSGEKTFQAQLLDLQDFDRFWHNKLVYNREDENELVVISTPKTINGEWRFVCSKYNGGEIISCSTYQYQGQLTLIPTAPEGATALCKKILEVGYFPDSVFCVDICEDFDWNFWLLELTSFSSAGLYATDKKKIVNRVTEIVEFEWKLKNVNFIGEEKFGWSTYC